MTQKTYSKNRDRYQTSYGTSLKDVKGLNNRLLLLLSGGIRKVDPKTGEVIPLGRGFKRAIVDPVVDTARAGLKIVKPLVKSAYEELYVNPALKRDKEYQGKKKKYEDKTIDIKESELAGREVTITEGKGLKIQRGKTEKQKEVDTILNNSKESSKQPQKDIQTDGMSKKKKDKLIIQKKNNPFADVGYE